MNLLKCRWIEGNKKKPDEPQMKTELITDWIKATVAFNSEVDSKLRLNVFL